MSESNLRKDMPPGADDSLVEAALKVLEQPDPYKKAEYTYAIVDLWESGQIKHIRPDSYQHLKVPDRPARADDTVKLLPPGLAPKRGKGGTLASRQTILHSLVHIENWAVDLSWDIIARFGLQPQYPLPKEFFDDFVKVAEDECRHFSLLHERLKEIGSYYGAFAAHDGLWESAERTSTSLPARLAVEHCVHEARGLDVLPSTIQKFRGNGDEATAKLLETVVYPEEISHCAAGVRWLKHLHKVARESSQGSSDGNADWRGDARKYDTVEQWFHALIRANFYGGLRPPFNDEARAKAGFGPEWYLPLASQPSASATDSNQSSNSHTAPSTQTHQSIDAHSHNVSSAQTNSTSDASIASLDDASAKTSEPNAAAMNGTQASKTLDTLSNSPKTNNGRLKRQRSLLIVTLAALVALGLSQLRARKAA